MSLASHNTTIDRLTDHSVRWSLVGGANGASTHSIVINSPTFRVGRRTDMDLSIDSACVSGYHADLFQVRDCLFFRDVGSTNGSFLNGNRIVQDVELHHGDRLDLGGTTFRVVRNRRDESGVQPVAIGAAFKTSCLNNAVESLGRRSLARLLNEGSLAPCYQAVHDLRSGTVVGYEFLARSNYPGIETAGQLFSHAAKAGRDVELSVFCRQQAYAHSHLLKSDVPVFVNTHPAEPLLEVVLPQMRELRQAYPDRAMVLEIHEAANTEPGLIRELRQKLASIGVQLAFDDFGAGQTRIREMISASADYIKFDPSLIRDLEQVSTEQRRFFASILSGIRSEGTITVAEGIETIETAALCRELGFDLVQGYLYGRPTVFQ